MQSFEEGLNEMLQGVARGDVSAADGSVGVDAVSACIGMLLSAREGHAVSLPIDPNSEHGQELWPIS